MRTSHDIRAEAWYIKLEYQLNPTEKEVLHSLESPAKIQAFLDSVPYSSDKFYRCPLRLLRERKGHCFDGALFAAMALRCIGHPPLVLELIPNERDDDHMLAVYKKEEAWGAIAQSNFSGLRFREAVYRTLRELVMSYFEDFFNPVGEKTLRGYRGPISLQSFDRLDWMTSDAGLEILSDGMNRFRTHPLITEEEAAELNLVDERSLKAGLLGANPDGLYQVPDKVEESIPIS